MNLRQETEEDKQKALETSDNYLQLPGEFVEYIYRLGLLSCRNKQEAVQFFSSFSLLSKLHYEVAKAPLHKTYVSAFSKPSILDEAVAKYFLQSKGDSSIIDFLSSHPEFDPDVFVIMDGSKTYNKMNGDPYCFRIKPFKSEKQVLKSEVLYVTALCLRLETCSLLLLAIRQKNTHGLDVLFKKRVYPSTKSYTGKKLKPNDRCKGLSRDGCYELRFDHVPIRALQEAADSDYQEAIDYLIRSKPNLLQASFKGMNPLEYAIKKTKSKRLVAILYREGLTINLTDLSIFNAAIENGHLDTIKQFLASREDFLFLEDHELQSRLVSTLEFGLLINKLIKLPDFLIYAIYSADLQIFEFIMDVYLCHQEGDSYRFAIYEILRMFYLVFKWFEGDGFSLPYTYNESSYQYIQNNKQEIVKIHHYLLRKANLSETQLLEMYNSIEYVPADHVDFQPFIEKRDIRENNLFHYCYNLLGEEKILPYFEDKNNEKCFLEKNINGQIPLHLLCQPFEGGGYVRPLALRLLMNKDAENKMCLIQDNKGRLALHYLLDRKSLHGCNYKLYDSPYDTDDYTSPASFGYQSFVLNQMISVPGTLEMLDNEGYTPLHYAARSLYVGAFKWLIRFALIKDINLLTSDGKTLLHVAVINEQNDVAKYLVEETDIDLTIKDRQGLRASDYVKDSTLAEYFAMQIEICRAREDLLSYLGTQLKSLQKNDAESSTLTNIHRYVMQNKHLSLRQLNQCLKKAKEIVGKRETGLYRIFMLLYNQVTNVYNQNEKFDEDNSKKPGRK